MDPEIPGYEPTRGELMAQITAMLACATDDQLKHITLNLDAGSRRAQRIRERMLAEAKPDRQPVAYGYCRISALARQDRSLGIESQKAAILGAYEERFKPAGFAWGGYFVDPDTSGAKKLDERKAGRAMCLRLSSADMIVCLSFERLFRSVVNGITQLDRWLQRDIGVYWVRDRREFSKRDREGQWFTSLMLLLGQWERDIISARCREAKAIAKANGEVYCRSVPPGWTLVGAKGHRKKVVDWDQQRTIDRIVELRDRQNLPWEEIVRCLERDGHRYDYVRFRGEGGGYIHEKRVWKLSRCWSAYQQRKALGRPTGDDSPASDLPAA